METNPARSHPNVDAVSLDQLLWGRWTTGSRGARHECDLTATHMALGDEAFGAAWAARQALPLEQAIAEVLGEIIPA